ncbi:YdcH family protein [Alphaproteobacteria bacterium]|nr:YdcH family protein [Alphaproteobacteria bacterium]
MNMSVYDRIQNLENHHERLDEKISREQGRPLPNVGLLREMKVRKLRLKEELFSLLSR